MRGTKNTNIVAIILAGGKGERMGRLLNYKQFLKIGRKPLIFYSLEEFIRCRFIKQIIVVVPQEKSVYAQKLIHRKFGDSRLTFISGGITRKMSIHNALVYLKENQAEPDYIILHDASRPLISSDVIDGVVRGAIRYGAATTGTKAINLIFKGRNSFVTRAFDKDRLYYGFTPQCFKFSLLKKAYFGNDVKSGHNDSIELVRKVNKNLKIKIVEQYPNLKLTYKQDVPLIKLLLKAKEIE